MLLVRRLAPIALVAAVCGAAVVGAAATLPMSTSDLGAGGTAVASCDSGGVTVAYVGAPGDVTAIQVSDLDPQCNGGTAHATVDDGTGGHAASGTGTVASGGTSIAVAPPQPAEHVKRWHLAVVTP